MLPRDKQLHFSAGGIIAFIGAVLLATIGLDPVAAMFFGVLAGVGAGALKEVYDRQGHGTPDFWDYIATAVGAFVGGAFSFAVNGGLR